MKFILGAMVCTAIFIAGLYIGHDIERERFASMEPVTPIVDGNGDLWRVVLDENIGNCPVKFHIQRIKEK